MQKKREDASQLKELVRFEENPFVEAIGAPNVRKKTEMLYHHGRVVVNTEDGTVEDTLGIARVTYVEEEKFVKLYTDKLATWFELKAAGQRVAEFVMVTMQQTAIDRGQILITFYEYKKHYKERRGGSKSTLVRGLRELADKGMIARSMSSDDIWFINPALVFNGDRARFITEIRRKKKSTAEQLEAEGQMRLLETGDSERTQAWNEIEENLNT